MNKRFSSDNMIKSRLIEPSDIIRTFKLDRCCDFMEEKYNNPKLTQKEICNQLGFTDRTFRRYRNDINMDSPYRMNNKKKKPKQTPINIGNDDSKPATEEEDRNKRINKRIKNRLKGGNVSDTHTSSGGELIEQTFQNDKVNSILENKQEDNKKCITIARRMVDNT